MFWLISPPTKTNWRFPKEDQLIPMLRQQWPGIAVSGPGSRDFVVPNDPLLGDTTFRIPADGDHLQGSQDPSRKCQQIEGPIELVARYAAWIRGKVDSDQALILYDEGYNTVVPLEIGIEEHEIMARIDAQS